MNEQEAFVGRAFVRALRDAEPAAAWERLRAALGGRHREIAERMARQMDARDRSDSRVTHIDPVGNAAATARLARERGLKTTEGFWLIVERSLSSEAELMNSLALASQRAQFITLATAVFALLVTVMYVLLVLPQFEYLFAAMQAELPGLTSIVLTGPAPALLLAALVAIIAMAAIALIRPAWFNGLRAAAPGKLDLLLRLMSGGRAARDYRALVYVNHAAALVAAGMDADEALAAAGRTAGIHQSVDYRSATGGEIAEALPATLVAAGQLGQLPRELDSQRELRLHAVLASAEQAQLRASWTIRAFLYAIVATLLVAMYLPIFRLGATI